LDKASQNKIIKDIAIKHDQEFPDNILRKIQAGYCKALYFNQTMVKLQEIFSTSERNLSRFLYESIKNVCEYLKIDTKIVPTSSIYPKGTLKGQDRIIDICIRESATCYVNLPGGISIYDSLAFQKYSIDLKFIKPNFFSYSQATSNFIPYLSIIDVLMWNSVERVSMMAKHFKVV
jgi:hypothetical protein